MIILRLNTVLALLLNENEFALDVSPSQWELLSKKKQSLANQIILVEIASK